MDVTVTSIRVNSQHELFFLNCEIILVCHLLEQRCHRTTQSSGPMVGTTSSTDWISKYSWFGCIDLYYSYYHIADYCSSFIQRFKND